MLSRVSATFAVRASRSLAAKAAPSARSMSTLHDLATADDAWRASCFSGMDFTIKDTESVYSVSSLFRLCKRVVFDFTHALAANVVDIRLSRNWLDSTLDVSLLSMRRVRLCSVVVNVSCDCSIRHNSVSRGADEEHCASHADCISLLTRSPILYLLLLL